MDTASSQILLALEYLVKPIQVGTNLALLQLMWALLNGSFLQSRGAVHSALAFCRFDQQTVMRCWRVLRYGVWSIEELLQRWQMWATTETVWQARCHGGYHPVAYDITTFWRPKLQGWSGRGFHRIAGRLLTGVAVGIVVRVGQLNGQRIPLLHKLLRAPMTATDEKELVEKLLVHARKRLDKQEVALFDAGFELAQIQAADVTRYVVRMASNCTFRRNYLTPKESRRGAPRKFGDYIRPLRRWYKENEIAASVADERIVFYLNGQTVTAQGWRQLVRSGQHAGQAVTVNVWAFHDPRYRKPMVLATSLSAPAEVILQLYLDRWPVEQVPLVAKQMLGLQRMFVHATMSVYRLPELALMVANVLTVMAASLPAIPSGYWDKHPQKTSGRLRRAISRTDFCDLTVSDPRIRRKASVTGHLPRGKPRKTSASG